MPGDYVIKSDYNDPDLAVVVDVDEDGDRNISIAFCHQLEEESEGEMCVAPTDLQSYCEEAGVEAYSYEHSELRFEPQY